jgi:hypothetical protein
MKVFKFFSNEYGLQALKLQRLKVATFNDLNDPFELLSFGLSNKTHRNLFSNWKKVITLSTGLLCFSKNWHNPLLWSHYGDRHQGIALEFNLDDKYAIEVFYEPNRLIYDLDKELASDRIDSNLVHRLLATKFKHWQYEEEVRMMIKLSECDRENGLFFYKIGDPIKLESIILGPLCSLNENIISENINNKPKINIIKSRLAFKTFTIVKNNKYKGKEITGKA